MQNQSESSRDDLILLNYNLEKHLDMEEDDDYDFEPEYKQQQSRYKLDFEQLEQVGEGGAGRVFKAKNRFDGIIYAIKKVRLSKRDEEENERIMREVKVISRLNHQYIVRYN